MSLSQARPIKLAAAKKKKHKKKQKAADESEKSPKLQTEIKTEPIASAPPLSSAQITIYGKQIVALTSMIDDKFAQGLKIISGKTKGNIAIVINEYVIQLGVKCGIMHLLAVKGELSKIKHLVEKYKIDPFYFNEAKGVSASMMSPVAATLDHLWVVKDFISTYQLHCMASSKTGSRESMIEVLKKIVVNSPGSEVAIYLNKESQEHKLHQATPHETADLIPCVVALLDKRYAYAYERLKTVKYHGRKTAEFLLAMFQLYGFGVIPSNPEKFIADCKHFDIGEMPIKPSGKTCRWCSA